MKKFIAERKLIAESKETGIRKDIVVKIGIPYWVEENELAACPIEWVGLFENVADAPGVDLLSALQVASNIDVMINLLKDKYNFFWSSGERYDDDSD